MKIKYFILIFLSLILISNSFSKECGKDIACECGDFVKYSYTLNDSLNCNSNGLSLNRGVTLDCNFNKITGNNIGSGILVSGRRDINIKNCIIENFKYGISTDTRKFLVAGVLGGSFYNYENPYNINIFNNKILNNTNSISSKQTSNFQIYDNLFINKNNSKFSVQGLGTHYIYNNTFKSEDFFFENNLNKYFCKFSKGNNYIDSNGPNDCSCMYLYDNMLINSNINLCNFEYDIKNNINIKTRSYTDFIIDCNNATLVGNGKINMNFENIKSSKILNCNFNNFSNALNFIKTRDIIIEKSNFINNKNNIYLDSYSIIKNISDNFFYNFNNLNIRNPSNSIINANNNFWGFNDIESINNSFYKPEFVNYSNFKVIRDENINDSIKDNFNNTDLRIENVFILNNSIYAIINPLNINTNYTLTIFEKNNTKILNISSYILNSNQDLFILNNISLFENKTFEFILDYENLIEEKNKENNVFNFIYELPRIKLKYFFDTQIISDEILKREIENYLNVIFRDEIISNNVQDADIYIKFDLKTNNLFNIQEKQFQSQLNSNLNNLTKKTNITITSKSEVGLIYSLKEYIKNIEKYNKNTIKYKTSYLNNDAYFIYKFLYFKDSMSEDILIKKIKNILYDKNYEIYENKIDINGFEYNIIKINSLKKEMFYDDFSYQKPIIFSAGLWSNVSSWFETAKEFSNLGFTTYIIELTGNLELENNNDFVYNSNDLKSVLDSYLTYIKEDSNLDEFIYIGHSNGGYSMLNYLNDNISSFQNKDSIQTLISIGSPNSFSEESLFLNLIKKYGYNSIENFKEEDIEHITMKDLVKNFGVEKYNFIKYLNIDTNSSNKISTDLFKDYFYMINSTDDLAYGVNKIENLLVFTGNPKIFHKPLVNKINLENSDLIVPVNDGVLLYELSSTTNKYYKEFDINHISMIGNKEIVSTIKKYLLKNKFE